MQARGLYVACGQNRLMHINATHTLTSVCMYEGARSALGGPGTCTVQDLNVPLASVHLQQPSLS